MALNGSSLNSQSRSDDSSIDRAPVYRTMRTQSTLLEDLFFSLSQSYARTDVALVLSHGPVIKMHKFALCLSDVMKRRIQEAQDGGHMYDDRHLRIHLPETLHLCPTVQVIFLLYLGDAIYSVGESINPVLTWFGVSKVIRTRFEDQEFYEDYKSEKMRKFQRFSVPYTMNGVGYLIDVEGNCRSTGSSSNNSKTPIQLFCSDCGTVFNTSEEIENHHLVTECSASVSLKLINKKNPALECNTCGNLFARLLKKSTSNRLSGASSIPGSARRTYHESIGERICQRCSPAAAAAHSTEINSTPLPQQQYSFKYCFRCLLVFETEQDEQNHDVGCFTLLGKGQVGNLHTDKCNINNCGMVFVEAPSITEGIYHHVGIAHNIKRYKSYGFDQGFPVCLVCGVKNGASDHCLDSVGDFLLNVYQCFQAKKKKMKRNPPLATKLVPDNSIQRELDSSKWYQRLTIHTEEAATKGKRNRCDNSNKNPQPTAGTSKQTEQPAEGRTTQDGVGPRPKTRQQGAKIGTKKPPATAAAPVGNPKEVPPSRNGGPMGTKGNAPSGKKKQNKKP